MSARHAAHAAAPPPPRTPGAAPIGSAPPAAPAGRPAGDPTVAEAGQGALTWWNEHIGPYAAVTHAQDGLRLVARHTGVPVVLVAALALVLSWRLARRLTRLALEVSLAAALVLALTRLGLITW